jgi:hypothetical protein
MNQDVSIVFKGTEFMNAKVSVLTVRQLQRTFTAETKMGVTDNETILAVSSGLVPVCGNGCSGIQTDNSPHQ